MGGFNAFLFNYNPFNGQQLTSIYATGDSPIIDRITIEGSILDVGASSPSHTNGINSNMINTSVFNGALFSGTSGQNQTISSSNEIPRIAVALD